MKFAAMVRAATGLALCLVALSPPSGAVAGSGYLVDTGGGTLVVRSGAGTNYRTVGKLPDKSRISISCQAFGTPVKGPRGRSDVWDQVGSGRFVSDAFVRTGHAGKFLATCSTFPSGPVLDKDFADPDVVKVGGTYFAYASARHNRPEVQRASSSDLRRWHIIPGSALRLPAWAAGEVWAPEVFRRPDGRMVMWFTATSTTAQTKCIGVATASSARATFQPTDDEPAICPVGAGGAIDPSSFLDSNGRRYILWKTDGNSLGRQTDIYIREVRPDGISFKGSAPRLLSSADKNDGNARSYYETEQGIIEAPTMVKRGGTYVLLYSQGGYCGVHYSTSYAVSSSLTGGFRKAPAPLMTTDSFSRAIMGPGGQDVVVAPDGKPVLVFHGRRNGEDCVQGHHRAQSYRAMYVRELGFAGPYPVVRASTVRYEAEDAVLHHARVRSGAREASGLKVAAYIDFSDSWVEFRNVYVPRNQTVTLRVQYAAGAGPASYRVTVDGANQGSISLPNTGWDNWQQATKRVTLTEGFHTIRFRHGDRYAELDRLDVS